MSPSAVPPLQRERFHLATDPPQLHAHAAAMLRLLIAQDGSTTRLCEALTGGPVTLHLYGQRVVEQLPAGTRGSLPGSRFLCRVTALVAQGQVLMDNLSYIALDGLPADVRSALEAGTIPIGHLLSRLWVRRAFRSGDAHLFEQLWDTVGLPDPGASRSYTMVTPDGPCMLIAETFRRGLLVAPAR